MNVLVTGATGFLGNALCQELVIRGYNVKKISSRDADLTNKDSLLKFNSVEYEYIYHLAAWTQAGDFCLYHPGEQWIINQQINTNVLAWWQQYQPQAKMIAIGTSCSYDPSQELVENNYLVGDPIESLFTYAHTKRMLYIGLKALHKQFGLSYLYVVPSTLYGPGYHTDGRQMHFIFDLIRKIIRGKLYSETVTLWGDGYQKRELVFVRDFVNILLQINGSYSNDIFNIGEGKEHTIKEFAEIICNYVGYDKNLIEYDVTKYVGAKSKCLNINKIKSLFPEYKQMSIQTGIEETIDWFKQNLELYKH